MSKQFIFLTVSDFPSPGSRLESELVSWGLGSTSSGARLGSGGSGSLGVVRLIDQHSPLIAQIHHLTVIGRPVNFPRATLQVDFRRIPGRDFATERHRFVFEDLQLVGYSAGMTNEGLNFTYEKSETVSRHAMPAAAVSLLQVLSSVESALRR